MGIQWWPEDYPHKRTIKCKKVVCHDLVLPLWKRSLPASMMPIWRCSDSVSPASIIGRLKAQQGHKNRDQIIEKPASANDISHISEIVLCCLILLECTDFELWGLKHGRNFRNFRVCVIYMVAKFSMILRILFSFALRIFPYESIEIYLVKEDRFVIRGPFCQHGLTLIPDWISNHMPSNMWDEITYPFPNVNGATVEVWECISNFSPHFMMDVITYPWWE